jgi:indolepyruvate ferredoxin oxidoreductase alpha subunit
MQKNLVLLGDEALAQGALDAGLSGCYGYPGTPSTEVFEYAQAKAAEYGVHALWSANEKVAYEEALGMSFGGRRAMVTMKHVGLNVAADPFMNSALTGARGGFLLLVADDPGMHSSQNEQDSRVLAEFAKMPVLEPRNHQECYDMARYGLELSERLGIPVMIRMVTRLAHSRSSVTLGARLPQNALHQGPRDTQWTLLPSYARRLYRELLDKEKKLTALADESPFNHLNLAGADRSLGVVTSGLGTNYFLEAVGGTSPWPHLAIGHYPAPTGLLRELLANVDKVLFIEEGYPFLEARVRGLLDNWNGRLLGRSTGHVPTSGELTPDIAAAALGLPTAAPCPDKSAIPGRPPQLCVGCPHGDTFKAMKAALEGHPFPYISSDIGCYTLGYYQPFEVGDSCLCMGASITMASGASHAGAHPVLCVIGDSTFIHSGMTGLIGAVRGNNNMTVVILDNGTTAMTGTQESMATGENLDKVILGLGVDPAHFRVITPLLRQHEANVQVFREEIAHRGLSVVVARRPCIQIVKSPKA